MNHYEIVFLVHPDQKSDSEAILNKYCDQIKSSNGTIDRSELSTLLSDIGYTLS